jgi:sporulation protein YlmC with PRC-barrel domain
MLKKLMITTAIAGLMVGSAAAQGNPSTAPSASPSATPAAPAPAPAAKSTEMNSPAASTGSAKFISAQSSDQFLASKFKGTDVLGADNQKIGDVSDILFDKNGKILAYVVSVGGFLGINAKHVALEPAAFQVVPGDKSKNESDKLKISMNKEQLQQAANFEPYKAPISTTGMGGSARPSGMGISRPAPAPSTPK